MERMSGIDASFLYFETPTMHMHVCATIVFDPSTVPGGYSFDLVRSMLESRLHLVPPFRRKLAEVPFRLHHPVWIEDPSFDLDYHLRRIGCPAPGGPEELAAIAADIAGRPLDRRKPLWEMWIVEGLEHGHVAAVAKMHHCTIDGVSGANLMVHLFDVEPEPGPKPPPEREWAPDREPSDLELVAYALRSRAIRPFQLARVGVKTIRSLAGVIQNRVRGDGASGATPFTAPRTSFNVPVSPHRTVAYARVALDDVKTVKNAFGTTVNDVVLAVCAGALRRYLEHRGELPDRPLVATCPVSVRSDADDGAVGANMVSAMFTSLATHVEDPVERLMAIRQSTRGAKDEHRAMGADAIMNLAEFAVPTLFSLAARVYSGLHLAARHPVIHNLVISNVPGPPMPLYFAGARLVALSPLGPIFDGAGLNITVISYRDSVDFGLIADREAVPDLWHLAQAIPEAVAELGKAARAVAS